MALPQLERSFFAKAFSRLLRGSSLPRWAQRFKSCPCRRRRHHRLPPALRLCAFALVVVVVGLLRCAALTPRRPSPTSSPAALACPRVPLPAPLRPPDTSETPRAHLIIRAPGPTNLPTQQRTTAPAPSDAILPTFFCPSFRIHSHSHGELSQAAAKRDSAKPSLVLAGARQRLSPCCSPLLLPTPPSLHHTTSTSSRPHVRPSGPSTDLSRS